MRRAIAPSIGDETAFLENFKARGWYLDDLILTPLDKQMKARERDEAHWQAANGLRDRIAEYRPSAIVALLRRIHRVVQVAADKAGSNVRVRAVSFPGYGQQSKFRAEMAAILPDLPTS